MSFGQNTLKISSNGFQFQKVRLWAIAHVSSKCQRIFQFQKVRLWVSEIVLSSSILTEFQFQKVRLWVLPALSSVLIYFYFNSKRCDYETNITINLNKEMVFQFQKVRLWAPDYLQGVEIVKNFNSKRCDYEFITYRMLLSLKNISIPKGAIMRLPKKRVLFFSRRFQFQKVRLWVSAISISFTASHTFQFQKVRLWACCQYRNS